MHDLLVAIPFFRNASLVEPLLRSLSKCRDDLVRLQAKLIFLIDSPEDEELRHALMKGQNDYLDNLPIEIIVNSSNKGFIKTANTALQLAADTRTDVILLNSDIEVFPGALLEMHAVALSDHMIGFVSPRSNNATICSIPWDPDLRNRPPDQSFSDYQYLRRALPRVEYVPTVVGFAIYIKHTILRNFGLLDEIYGFGYNEENDLIMRANRCGYRAAIANHAFVYHKGEQSFNLQVTHRLEREQKNRAILDQRFGEYGPSIENYFGSSGFHAYRMLTGMLVRPSKKRAVAFDMTSVGAYHNGTFWACKYILRACYARFHTDFDIFAIATEEVFNFHAIDSYGKILRVDSSEDNLFTAIVRVGQPFYPNTVSSLRKQAVLLGIFMLDTIAIDCQYLNKRSLHSLWQDTIDLSDCVFFNSEYTKTQYLSRFTVDDQSKLRVLLHSTEPNEYPGQVSPSKGTAVLLIGNDFAHKAVGETIERIRALETNRDVIVFGTSLPAEPDLEYIHAGSLSEDDIDALYSRASIVLFPSHYEGFGFPILEALRREKPIVARTMPVYEEIRKSSFAGHNIHLFDTTDEMVRAALSGELRWSPPLETGSVSSFSTKWQSTAEGIYQFIQDGLLRLTQQDLQKKLSIADKLSDISNHGVVRMLERMLTENEPKLRIWRKQVVSAKSTAKRAAAEINIINLSPLFDAEYYRRTYKDIAISGVDPARHFWEYGSKEGRNPGPYFNTTRYFEDEMRRVSNMNPLLHFHCHGIFEGRELQTVETGYRFALRISNARSKNATSFLSRAIDVLSDRLPRTFR